jgi:ABC-2 type transport system ATP-binding protein
MITALGVTQGFGRQTILSDINLHLSGGTTALLGPNGAGKTTLLRTLSTAIPPQLGQISVGGQVVGSEKEARRARRTIGYLPQRFGFDPRMRVADFIKYGAWLRGVPTQNWEQAVREALEYVDLGDQSKLRMGKISGGTRQRAAIAWAIVGNPGLVLLDEPTVGLDPHQRINFRTSIAGLRQQTVLLSTHQTDDVDAICDKVIVLGGGRILFDGSVEQLRSMDNTAMDGNSAIERAYMSLVNPEKNVC